MTSLLTIFVRPSPSEERDDQAGSSARIVRGVLARPSAFDLPPSTSGYREKTSAARVLRTNCHRPSLRPRAPPSRTARAAGFFAPSGPRPKTRQAIVEATKRVVAPQTSGWRPTFSTCCLRKAHIRRARLLRPARCPRRDGWPAPSQIRPAFAPSPRRRSGPP